jgi:hypothetical protein
VWSGYRCRRGCHHVLGLLPIPAHFSWVPTLALTHLLVPQASFPAHLAGVCAGLCRAYAIEPGKAGSGHVAPVGGGWCTCLCMHVRARRSVLEGVLLRQQACRVFTRTCFGEVGCWQEARPAHMAGQVHAERSYPAAVSFFNTKRVNVPCSEIPRAGQ